MDLRHAIAALRRRFLVLIALATLGLGLGAAHAFLTTPQYRSTSSVFFSLNRGETVNELAQGSTYLQGVVQSYADIAKLPVVLDPVIKELRLPHTARELGRKVSVTAQPNTVLMEIAVTDPSPEQAARVANAITVQLVRTVARFSPQTAGQPAITVTTISSATPASSPSSPRRLLDLAVGLLGGLVLGVAVAAIREVLASPVNDRDAVTEATSAPLVGSIIDDPKVGQRPLPISTHPHLPRAESFLMLRTNLQLRHTSDASQCVVVSSALRGEGRTSVAVNLAIAMSHTTRRVLLVDADLRRSAVSQLLKLKRDVGLSSVLEGNASLEEATQSWLTQTWGSHSLHVMTAGPNPANPSEVLASEEMTKVLESLKNSYDVVVIDSPPLLSVADAAILAPHSDGVLLVVDSRRTEKEDLREAVMRLGMAGGTVLGVVLNRTQDRGREHYGSRRNLLRQALEG